MSSPRLMTVCKAVGAGCHKPSFVDSHCLRRMNWSTPVVKSGGMNKQNREEIAAKAREREAEAAGCTGLLLGQARNLNTGAMWDAFQATKGDGPFYCQTCYSDVVVRKCSEKVDHFAHNARLSPVLGAKEMALHNACTKEICEALAARFADGKWQVERPIPRSKDGVIPLLVPDISGRMGNGVRVAVEVQVSALTVPKIIQRTTAYAQRNIALVWVVPLHGPMGTEPFRPRLYERYLHSIFRGRTYYWWPGLGATVKPMHYGPTRRMIPYSEWREEGEDRSAGGYLRRYKTIKVPVYGPDLDLADCFDSEFRGAFTPENERKQVPACRIWRDELEPWWRDDAEDITPRDPDVP